MVKRKRINKTSQLNQEKETFKVKIKGKQVQEPKGQVKQTIQQQDEKWKKVPPKGNQSKNEWEQIIPFVHPPHEVDNSQAK